MTVLSDAEAIVSGRRQDDYGAPAVNHARTAALWSAYLGQRLTPEDVCLLNILQKISRCTHSITRDSLVDIAGYARNIELLSEAGQPANPSAGCGDSVPTSSPSLQAGPPRVSHTGGRDD